MDFDDPLNSYASLDIDDMENCGDGESSNLSRKKFYEDPSLDEDEKEMAEK